MDSLLLEIGSEEIPAGYIEPALKALTKRLLTQLSEARIEHGGARTFGTPKRLAVEISNVAAMQKPQESEIVGPPERVGYDPAGNLTIAGKKFAEKVGVAESAISVKETPKGRYLYALKTEETVSTHTFLQTMLPEAILATPFPKTMRWADLKISFARPIVSVLALLGEQVVPFSVGNIQSGATALGHRFMHPEPVSIARPEEYAEKMRAAGVLVDIEERKALVKTQIAKVAAEMGGTVLADDDLVDTVANLIEHPYAVAGKFDEQFLEVPREVLITAMREHQKYFAVVNDNNDLLPCFIAVNNTRAKDMALVARGHERVLRARLADAQFFYHVDLKVSADERVEKLKNVLFQAQLGSVHAKVMRVQALAEYLADAVCAGGAGQDIPDLKPMVSRAAYLCKSDLVSQMVIEFTKLQGVMGKIYASLAGEPDLVAAAIEEHYRPVHSGGILPATITGALLAIADKIDSICGCFAAGLIPTGAADPYALRRQGIGIVQIMLDRNFTFSLRALIETAVRQYGERSGGEVREITGHVDTFLRNRMEHLLEEEGFSKDVIAAVTAAGADQVPDVRNRVRALQALKAAPDFDPLAVAFKRVVNIIKKADMSQAETVDASRFQEDCESALLAEFNRVKEHVAQLLREGDYSQSLLHIAGLRSAVDAFFDGAMVMTDDAAIRNNRLALLRRIAELFEKIADFSKIST